MIEFRMPSLGADMDAGTLAAWCVVKESAPPLQKQEVRRFRAACVQRV